MYTPVCAEADISPAYSFKRLLHAPASGYRYRETGALTNVGSNGYVWSSSPYAAGNVSAGSMDFSVSFVRPLNYYARAYAFPVRCVQHLQAAFY
ncbi:MAG: fibrobacter succinogenes major paralogous domain-containing protein [Alistipes sp.]|nr:fibrobacter succinogenes major paralogous domain-containing protein [Alistipes sp.]